MKIPTPEFYVLYNGNRSCPEEVTYRLSDNFITEAPENSIEVVVKMINIGYNEENKLLKRCKPLREYSRFIFLVTEALKDDGNLNNAVEKAILAAKQEGILEDFLKKHGTEVVGMLFTEVTKERYGELRELDGYEKGVECGMAQGLTQGIERGMAQGMERGMAQGMERGIAQGIERGIAQGIERGEKSAFEAARKIYKLAAAGKSQEAIAKELGIPAETVTDLLAD